MNMHWMDWTVVFTVIIFFIVIGYSTKKYTRSAADFLAANRCSGRYLLTVAEGISGLGAVSILAITQQLYTSGFGAGWWVGRLR